MFCKLVRIGRDAELRKTPQGTPLISFPAAYDVGFGDNKKSQWIDCTLFGQKAENLAQHIQKGNQIVIYGTDLCVETWDKNDGSGTGHKLCCKFQDFDFVSAPRSDSSGTRQRSSNANGTQKSNLGKGMPSPDVFDDDIPF